MSMVKDREMVGESPLKDGLRSTDPSSPSTEQEDCPRDSLVSEKEMLRSDWTGPNDKTNPRNWPVPVRVYQTAIPSLCGFVITLATSVIVPAIPLLQERFDAARETAILTISLYTLGLALGPIIAAPLSELFGRRIVYLITMPLLCIFSAGAGCAQNIQTVIICRFFAGLGGSAALAVGAGTIADIWDIARDGGPAGCSFVLAPFMGSSIGILVGAYIIAEYKDDWRYSMWAVLFVGAPVILSTLFLRETSKIQILARSSQRDIQIRKTPSEFMRHLKSAVTRPLHMLFTEPIVAFLCVYTAFAFAMIWSFFGSFPYIFETIYHFDFKSVGLAFLSLIVGFFLGIMVFGIFDKTIYAKAVVKSKGHPAPEHRLYAAMLGSILLPISLFWFAWSAREDVHWIAPVLAGVPFGAASIAIFLSASSYLVDVYQSGSAASALAANGILRYGSGAAFPLFTIQMYQAVGIRWAGSIFAFIAVLMLPVPWILFKYGKGLRARSGYDTVNY